MDPIIVVGGGAAGMAAAVCAAREKEPVILLEKNEKLGKKLYITGKGRCNVTNAAGAETFFENIITNPRFLYSSFHAFTNRDMMALLEEAGVPLKVERGQRVFPVSDKSSDIISGLERLLKREGVRVRKNAQVLALCSDGGHVRGVSLKSGETLKAGCVIVATGGLSYAQTGCDGDGYRFAREAGHTVTPLLPALVPLSVRERKEAEALEGLSLRNVGTVVYCGKRKLFSDFGEMLFTHDGVSGPLMLSASSVCAKAFANGPLRLEIDLKPALSPARLDERIRRDFTEAANKQFKNSLTGLYPSKLIPVIVARSGIDPDKKANGVTKAERERLAALTKALTFTLDGLKGFSEAVITQGGVSVKEVNPKTMESKRLSGLFFAGEVLDVDALTGGFNLQVAWSTGWAAGKGAAGRLAENRREPDGTF